MLTFENMKKMVSWSRYQNSYFKRYNKVSNIALADFVANCLPAHFIYNLLLQKLNLVTSMQNDLSKL